MSRYCGDVDSTPILEAASHWKTAALLRDGSVFTDASVWTLEALEALDRHFVRNLDEGEGSFLNKLQTQLQPAPPGAKKLAAEMLWLLLLCPSNTGPARKRADITLVWSWSAEQLPSSASPWLTDQVLSGIGSGGTAYQTGRWRELVFCINLTLKFKRMEAADRERLANDPWAMAEWIEAVPDSGARQFRHMLLFLLFPDEFERIFGKGDRRAVALAFSKLLPQTVNAMSPLELDRTLQQARVDLESRYNTKELDYYVPPLAEQWRRQDFQSITQGITADHVLKAIAQIDSGGVPERADSTGYDLLYATRRYPPKLVLSLAARFANGADFDRAEFTGGEDSPAFRLLRTLGFEIIPKAVLTAILQRFLEQAARASTLTVSGYPSEYRGLLVKVSFGKGNLARIPWVAFLGPGHTPTQGTYPVLLYYRDAAQLIVAYGISETSRAEIRWPDIDKRQTIAQYLQEKVGRSPERYGDSFVEAAFTIAPDLDQAAVAAAMDRVIDAYKPLLTVAAEPDISAAVVEEEALTYTLDDALEGLFIKREAFGSLIERLRIKRNLILQGPPGVGKTFFAKRMAMALVGSTERTRVGLVQFHQTYSYEDFVQGYRPGESGGFERKNGLFYDFCKQAAEQSQLDFVFIIDEINRGNLSKIFGELLMLIEADKRHPEWAVPLTYARSTAETFYVPPNVYVLGLMNTADRSLAMVDYALRRRFAFATLEPGFTTPQFAEYLRNARAPEPLVTRLVRDMQDLNAEIVSDRANLGPGFRIGHSYFCSVPASTGATEDWYDDVIRTEILPLLSEYWFDNPSRVEEWERRLLGH